MNDRPEERKYRNPLAFVSANLNVRARGIASELGTQGIGPLRAARSTPLIFLCLRS